MRDKLEELRDKHRERSANSQEVLRKIARVILLEELSKALALGTCICTLSIHDRSGPTMDFDATDEIVKDLVIDSARTILAESIKRYRAELEEL